MKPPPELDSAKVLYWAWAGNKPFGTMQDTNGKDVAEIYGFAICFLDDKIYRFSCDHHWAVQNDMDFSSIQEALDAQYPQYQNQPVHWNKFDNTDIDDLISESQLIKFYREVGERRIIQKIIQHLNSHNCKGMGVQSEGKDVWVLSIQKKDVKIACEIAQQNIG
jgi:hypothetical protein